MRNITLEPPAHPRTTALAAFDVDGTLARGDTLLPFLVAVAGRSRVVRAFVRSRADLLGWPSQGRRTHLKEHVLVEVLGGLPADELAEAGRRYASHLVDRRLRTDVVARLQQHQQHGHRTALVSASLGAYLRPLGQLLEVDHVLCTDVEVVDGRCTGRLDGPNCRGPEKVVRLRAVLTADDDVWAYGNDGGDRDLLALAHHPYLVTRRGRLGSAPPTTASGRPSAAGRPS